MNNLVILLDVYSCDLSPNNRLGPTVPPINKIHGTFAGRFSIIERFNTVDGACMRVVASNLSAAVLRDILIRFGMPASNADTLCNSLPATLELRDGTLRIPHEETKDDKETI